MSGPVIVISYLLDVVRLLLRQRIVRFIIVGGTATCVHAGTTILLVDGLRLVEPTLATILGTVVGIATSYLGNWAWTFGATGGHGHYLPRFLLVYSVTMGMNGGVMYVMQQLFHIYYIIPLFITLSVSPVITYLLNKHLVFRHPPRSG
jgi:putative flippase GtrA